MARHGSDSWLRRRGPGAGIVLLFFASPFIVFPWPFIASGMISGGDDLHGFLPWLAYAARGVRAFNVLWAPDLFLGVPMAQLPEVAAFYPLTWLVSFLDPIPAFAAYSVAHYVIAQAGAYLYLRGAGAGRLPAAFGALAYGYAGFMMGHRDHTPFIAGGAWAPWFLHFLHRALHRNDARSYLGAALTYAALPLAGANQYAVYLAVVAVILHGTIALLTRSLRPLVVVMVALVPCGLLTALRALPAMELASGAALIERSNYALSVRESFHPVLLPFLALPAPHLDEELYSHAGVPALLAALVALLAWRGRALVRAWGVVAAVALLLMMGKHVPLLPQLLHELPVVRVFRVPARHNFELGLAVAMLAGLGLERLRRTRRPLPGGTLPWLILPPALLIASALAVQAVLPSVADSLARDQLSDLDPWRAAGVASAFAALFALAATPRGPRGRRAGLLLLMAAALAEPTLKWRPWTLYQEQVPDYAAAIRRADFRADRRRWARMLVSGEMQGEIASLRGNLPLLVPGVHSLTGYASAAPRDAAAVLELDMQGHPLDPADLRWSRLPEIFGVTHLISPSPLCGRARITRSDRPGLERCMPRGLEGIAAGPADEPLACFTDLGADAYDLEAAAEVRTRGGAVKLDAFIKGSPDDPGSFARFTPLPLPRAPRFETRTARFDTEELRQLRFLLLATEADEPAIVEARDLRLRFRKKTRVALIAAGVAGLTLEGARPLGAGHILEGTGDPSRSAVLARITWGEKRAGEYSLEVPARAIRRPDQGVRIHLIGEDGTPFGPDYLMIPPGRLGPSPSGFSWIVQLEEPLPARAVIALELRGRGAVEIGPLSLHRLDVTHETDMAEFAGDANVEEAKGASFADNIVRLGPGPARIAWGFSQPYQLPRRPVTIIVSAPWRLPGAVFHLQTWRGDHWAPPHAIPAAAFRPVHRYSRTFEVSPDATGMPVRLSPAGRGPVGVMRLMAENPCWRRGYQPARRLQGGYVVLRNRRALPRVYSVTRSMTADGLGDVTRKLRDSPRFRPGRVAIVDRSDLPKARRFAPARILRARIAQQSVTVTAEARRTAFIVVNDRFDPHWAATIDGRPARIFRVNGLVRGVMMPAGRHVIRMRYEAPASLALGAALFGVGLALALLAPAIARRLLGHR